MFLIKADISLLLSHSFWFYFNNSQIKIQDAPTMTSGATSNLLLTIFSQNEMSSLLQILWYLPFTAHFTFSSPPACSWRRKNNLNCISDLCWWSWVLHSWRSYIDFKLPYMDFKMCFKVLFFSAPTQERNSNHRRFWPCRPPYSKVVSQLNGRRDSGLF